MYLLSKATSLKFFLPKCLLITKFYVHLHRFWKEALLQKSFGEVAEWSIAAVLKTVVPRGTRGSNPCLSAINAENQQIAKQTPNFTPKNVKLGVFVFFKMKRIFVLRKKAWIKRSQRKEQSSHALFVGFYISLIA